MNPFNRTRELLLHVLEAIGRIEPYIARGKDAFYGDELVYTFIAHWLADAGESVKGLPPNFGRGTTKSTGAARPECATLSVITTSA